MSHFCRSENVKIQRNFKNKIERKYLNMTYFTELTRISKRRLFIIIEIVFLFTGTFETEMTVQIPSQMSLPNVDNVNTSILNVSFFKPLRDQFQYNEMNSTIFMVLPQKAKNMRFGCDYLKS